ncbi:hypothetical protein AGMMS50229_01830 [Campylobacterota bacterium]|nr:hypothetical protein AGMMS50229_01830 [Campylobacterota bacterium]
MAVVGYHYFPGWIKAGFIGVDIFFVISGFLISGILLDNLKNNNFSIINFYQRRILRILPALIVVMVAVLVFGWFALIPDDYERLGKHILGGATFVSNFVLYFESGYWDTASHTKPLLHLWSLGVEEQFYLAFPIIIYLLWKIRNKLALSLILLFVVSFALNLLYFVSNPELDFYMPFTRFWELLAGVILAYFTKQGALDKLPIKWATAIGAVGLILLIASIWTINDKNFPGYKALMPAIGAVLFIAAGRESIVNRYLFSLKPIVFVGLISYPLYLWHWSLISFCFILFLDQLRVVRVGLLLASFVLAIGTYLWIEKPIRFGKSYRGAKAIGLLCALLLVGSIGSMIYFKNGIKDREYLPVIAGLYHAFEQPKFEPFENRCQEQYGIDCKLFDVGGKTTVALIGDSHSDRAFRSVAERNAKNSINTLQYATSGLMYGMQNKEGIAAFDQAADKLKKDQSIKKIIIALYYSVYMYGFNEKLGDVQSIGVEPFEQYLQHWINRLKSDHNEIFVMQTVPMLPASIQRMLLSNAWLEPMTLEKEEAANMQKEYMGVLGRLENATIIYTIDAFCPIDRCLLTDENGLALYSDNNHITEWAGGRFLINHALKPYLDQ